MIGYALVAVAFAAFLGLLFFASVLLDRLGDAHQRGINRVRVCPCGLYRQSCRIHSNVPGWYIPRQHDRSERDRNGNRW